MNKWTNFVGLKVNIHRGNMQVINITENILQMGFQGYQGFPSSFMLFNH